MTLSLDRIRHWRKKIAANERETYSPAELDSALAAAEALARLEEWLRAKEEWRYVQMSAVVGEGEVQATLSDGTVAGHADKIVALEAGDSLPEVLTAALDAAGGKA